MNSVKQLIEQLLSDKKLREGKNFSTRVYRDEPILQTAAQMAGYLPPRCREMRAMARSHEALSRPAEWLFYQQGKFMEDFEDDCPYRGEFTRYFPTYQAMNDRQMRGYFTWRTGVRRGEIAPAPLSFVFVYLYELLNQIGVPDPESGYRMLSDFWRQYRELDDTIDRYLSGWMTDYVVYYGLDRKLPAAPDLKFDEHLAILLRMDEHGDHAVFSALSALSSYRIENSRLYKKMPEAVEQTVCASFRAWADYYGKHRQKSLMEKLFGRKVACPYRMFQAAVFYDRRRYENYEYALNELHRYTCKNGTWYCEKYYGSRSRNHELGVFLRTVDRLMRLAYDFRPPLKEEPVSKTLLGIIRREISNLREAERQSARARVEIDLSKLQGIRQAADLRKSECTRQSLLGSRNPRPFHPPARRKTNWIWTARSSTFCAACSPAGTGKPPCTGREKWPPSQRRASMKSSLTDSAIRSSSLTGTRRSPLKITWKS